MSTSSDSLRITYLPSPRVCHLSAGVEEKDFATDSINLHVGGAYSPLTICPLLEPTNESTTNIGRRRISCL